MIEGVEVVLLAEKIKNVFFKKNIDEIYLKDIRIFSSSIVKHSPLDCNFIRHRSFLFENITTFGSLLFLPFEDNVKLCISFGPYGILSEEKNKYTLAEFEFYDGYKFYYNDSNKFGKFMIIDKNNMPRNLSIRLKNSIDWRNEDIAEFFYKRCMQTTLEREEAAIKLNLIDQGVISGIGSFYACEGLFASQIHPLMQTKKLFKGEIINLIENVKKIMIKSYKLGGIKHDGFLKSENYYKRSMINVFHKQGTICKKCQSGMIQKVNHFSKAPSYYCPICQKKFDR